MVRETSQVALVVKNLPADAGDIKDTDSFPGLGRSPRGRTNPMDRGTQQAMVHRVAKSGHN